MALSVVFKPIHPKIFVPLHGNVRHVKRWLRPTLISLKKRQKIFEEKTDPEKLLEYTRRSNFVEWNRDAEIYSFGKRLQEDFDFNLLKQAFFHKSYVSKIKEKFSKLKLEPENLDSPNNEELAVIGDEIISNHVWNYFTFSFPRLPREGIESIHKYLTENSMLGYISKELGTTHIIHSYDYPVEEETYAKTFKAIIGALNESQGIERSILLVRDLVVTQVAGKDINDYLPFDNYFQVLSGILERDGLQPPEPRIIFRAGVNTILASYHVGIYSNKKLIGHYFGEDTDTAIQMASLDALKRFFLTTDSSPPLRYDLVLPYTNKKSLDNIPINEWSLSKFEKTKEKVTL